MDDHNAATFEKYHDADKKEPKNKNLSTIADKNHPNRMERKRGGMKKPRSKRNHYHNNTRPGSMMIHANENLVFQTNVRHLEFDGKVIRHDGRSIKYIRTTEPYLYSFVTYAKRRWIGRSVLDVYHREFGSYPQNYYKYAIAEGRILVNNKRVDTSSSIIKDGDVLSHTVHLHEPAVAVASIESPYIRIVKESDDLLVVDKPGTIPVHACGGYLNNSLLKILEHKYGKLYAIHRLDRLTSGLVILARTAKMAQKFGKFILQRDKCQKLYLARVKGRLFPSLNNHPIVNFNRIQMEENQFPPIYGEWEAVNHQSNANVDKNLKQQQAANNTNNALITASAVARKNNAYGYWITDDNEIVRRDVTLKEYSESTTNVEDLILHNRNNQDTKVSKNNGILWLHVACPTRVAKHKDGICETGNFEQLDAATYIKTVKPSHTAFSILSYDATNDSTLVLCKPYTGRSHQIRLHLQYIGNPIANDPKYGGDIFYGDNLGKELSTRAQLKLGAIMPKLLLVKDAASTNKSPDDAIISTSLSIEKDEDTTASTISVSSDDDFNHMYTIKRENSEPIKDYIERTCVHCAKCNGEFTDHAMLEFLVQSREIWLHAWQYTIESDPECKESYRTGFPDWCLSLSKDSL